MATAKSDASPAPAPARTSLTITPPDNFFVSTGRPLPDMKISTPQSICSSEDLFKPVLPGKGSLAKALPVRADPIQYSRIATTLQKLYGGVILEDVHFLKECFDMLDGNDDGLLNRDELQRWIEMMSTPAPVDSGVPQTWQINWDEDMLNLLQRLGITDPGAECGITFTQFLLVMQDYYIALGAAKVHDIYMQMVDPDMSLEEWIEPECREEYVRTRNLMYGIAGVEGDGDGDGSKFLFARTEDAPEDGSPRAAEPADGMEVTEVRKS